MGKWIAIPLVAAVFATVIGMYFMFDRGQGRPNAALAAAQRASAAMTAEAREKAAALPAKASSMAAEVNENASREAAAASQEKKLVQPEDLPQGFIIVVTDKAKKASRESPIYMPSSHNGWNPGDPGMKLEPQSDMKWRIEWAKPKLDSRIAFKFARGSWEQVETAPDFNNIDNRLLPMVDVSTLKPGEKPVIELSIEQWADNKPGNAKSDPANRYRRVNVSAGTLKRLELTGGGNPSTVRDALVWLPPGYDDPANAGKSYPVLYMQDGQNLFDKYPGLIADWQADETAAKLIGEGKVEPLIIVGIPNTGNARISEYSPVEIVPKAGAQGAAYGDFIVNNVKPRVDRAFRTKPDAVNTAIGGASLGAVIALDVATAHPEMFSKVLAESPTLAANNRAVFRHLATRSAYPAKIYVGMGGREVGDAGQDQVQVAAAQAFGELARGKGLKGDNLRVVIDEPASHDEFAWAKRFGPALEYLFPAK